MTVSLVDLKCLPADTLYVIVFFHVPPLGDGGLYSILYQILKLDLETNPSRPADVGTIFVANFTKML